MELRSVNVTAAVLCLISGAGFYLFGNVAGAVALALVGVGLGTASIWSKLAEKELDDFYAHSFEQLKEEIDKLREEIK